LKVMVRGETWRMWDLLEATRETDAYLRGPASRRLRSALESEDGCHGLIPEAQYLLLSLSPSHVSARKKFQAAGQR
jgi:hypothetical protein